MHWEQFLTYYHALRAFLFYYLVYWGTLLTHHQALRTILKGTQAWNNFDFFYLNQILIQCMPLVNFRKISLLILRFSPEFRSSNIFSVTGAYAEPNFFGEISKKFFFKKFTLVLLDGFLHGFSKLRFFIVQICILIGDFGVIFENYSMRMLSIHGNDFIAHWAYEEMILSHIEHTRNEFSCMLSQR